MSVTTCYVMSKGGKLDQSTVRIQNFLSIGSNKYTQFCLCAPTGVHVSKAPVMAVLSLIHAFGWLYSRPITCMQRKTGQVVAIPSQISF